jgi:two-component system, OmpR family, phosphate regulon sensor histidine kinase PhoR
MIQRSIAVIIFLAVLSLGLISAGQVYWVKKAYELQEDEFNNHVNQALNETVKRLHLIENDNSAIEPSREMENGLFLVQINFTPSPYLLRTLMEDEFARKGLNENFEYGVYDCFSNRYEMQGFLRLSQDTTEKEQSESGLKIFTSEGHYLSVYFPHKQAHLIAQLEFWKYSSIVILLIVIFFSYTIAVLLREKRLSTVRNDFVNNMTHELKTPLSTLTLSTDALSSPGILQQPERFKTYLEIIKSETERLKGQLDKVLQLASLTPKKKSIQWEWIDVHEVIEKAFQIYQLKAKDREGSVEMSLLATQHWIKADRVHIANIIYNLLDNAIKYTDQAPSIKVRTMDKRGSIIIQIEDNGVGITLRQQRLIFDKFYRVPTGDVHDVKGFGLGLFYVKTMLKAQKGKIFVKSELGKGSVFTLQLPAYLTNEKHKA